MRAPGRSCRFVSPNLTLIPDPSRILIVSLDNLGDLVFASALAPPLRERYPGAEIGVLCKRYAAEVAPLIPGVSRVFAADPFWDRAPGRGKGATLPFLRALGEVRRASFDVAILAAAPWRTSAALALTGIPVRIGLERRRNARWLSHALPAEDVHRPVLEEEARLLEPLGIRVSGLRYRLSRPLGVLNSGARTAALHPFASKRNRCVGLEVWASVARSLDADGWSVLWIGSGAEMDEVRSVVGGEGRFVDREFGESLIDTARALAGAELFIGHDSGPLHVAGAFGVPVVGIFAPGEPDRTFPQGVGPARMISRGGPAEVTADDILGEVAVILSAARDLPL
ncbi:MAG: ADP-heptose--lipooligosaccharide heptosyltransferase [Gemmatimonadetes bacterium]|nr:ADP-heptose--lipooligosaccharide heptosyltransferase [Gemmatimonadota bacterium]